MHRHLLVLLLLAGCSTSTTDAALKVTVHFGTTPAQCAQVNVAGKNMKLSTSSPLMRGNSDLLVGILETADLGPTVDVQAVGFAAADCTGAQDDQSSTFHETFKKGKVDTVTLSLDGASGGGIGGGGGGAGGGINDGGGGIGGGGGGGVIPPETNCSNALDDDGDSEIDCFDTDCNGLLCDGGAVPSTCQSFMCKPANVESDCANHLDDNGNGSIDCADPTCDNRRCDDLQLCTSGDTCHGGVCTPASTFSCNAMNECTVNGSGVCLADGGCGYTAMSGSCDGGSCNGGVCLSLGFPYTPSSFNPQINTAFIAGPIVLNCGVSVYDSTFGVFTNWCNQPQPLTLNQFRANEPDLAVLAMQGLTIAAGSTLEITGNRPVVLAVYGDATVDGTLTGSADHDTRGTTTLPGSSCYPNHIGGDGHAYTQGGGGGGAFGKSGQKGGDGTGTGTTGGSGGMSWGGVPMDLNPGCSGGNGATYPTSLQLAPAGGASGAGVQLSASGNLTVTGKVSSNGGGGRAPVAGTKLGGGGGGSGGAILLEASNTNITSSALITAQGGAGASGGTDQAGDATQDGENGHDSDGDKALGGQGNGQAGNGGDGSSKNDANATSGDPAQDATAGGGGGGAGYGRIFLRGATACMRDNNALVAPDATGNCP